jgi:hypothetical protein
MKRTTILLENDLLTEVQRLAKERHTTTSQVIQQAVAEYVADPSGSQAPAPVTEEARASIEPFELLIEPGESPGAKSGSAPVGSHLAPIEGTRVATGHSPSITLILLAVGGLSALSALFLCGRAVGQLIGRGPTLGMLVNYLLPGLLLGVIATASFIIATQRRQPPPSEREDNQTR